MTVPRRLPALGLPLLLAACTTAPSVSGVTVQASPTALGCAGSGDPVYSSSLTRTVTGSGSFSQDVTWSLVPASAPGSLSATTGASVTFTYNQTGRTTPETVVVRATSVADASRYGDAPLTLIPCMVSDRNLKTNVRPANAAGVLAALAKLPVFAWSYKADPGTPHLGPMAQDFRAAFGLGGSARTIATVDEGGVALAAIQALNAKLEAENARLKAQLKNLDARLARLERLANR